ncbi:TonB-dependent receptor [Arachidicoccus terrestris]|uniref:TonB-dependent receptor n=1 Tax=Arachidicoccus terrestris TaxID=2875539 RepID=UPI001CC3BC64|nr:TonB-dependent receptor [Arachidicoccus terrestris]UAY54859.1 TonB-dependent receptor [Arachidicoccus terrestris]
MPVKKDTTSKNVPSVSVDSLPHNLSTVTITAFQGRGDGLDVAASLFSLNNEDLQFIDNSSFVSAFNTTPGVRLEQRSPGSLRLSIRGSLLRSPYGVRGIKFYLDGIPLTDAGGNTYLQSIGPEQIHAAEIIKGPAGSLYGAGTGGAVLLHSPAGFKDSTQNNLTLGYTMGSFGRINPTGSWEHSGKKSHTYISASHFYSKGDRAQDTAGRSIVNYSSQFKLSGALQLDLIGFYSYLHYQTPGGITKSQLGTDTTAYPRSIEQQAAIFNRTIFGGASLKSKINNYINNETAVLWSHTDFKNPFTTNYEKRKESNYGGRTVFSVHNNDAISNWKLLAGMEWIAGRSRIDNFGNNKGVPDTVQYKDRLVLQRKSFFVQFSADLDPQNKWHLQAGISTNQQKLRYHRLTDPGQLKDAIAKTDYLWSPKIGLTYKIRPTLAIYATAAKGFSTPTLAEIHPSDGRFEQNLQAERGWNLEGGVRGHAFNNHVDFEGSIYSFKLKNAIVRRADQDNMEYYVNAGVTSQKGAELWVRYRLFAGNQPESWISQVQISGSYSYQPYHFLNYQIEDNIYNGNPLTGVPKNIAVFRLNVESKQGFYLHTVLNATSRISLNDAASVYADAYQLLQSKIGYRFNVHKTSFDLYFGVDNILDQVYSLGNDINAYGGRYFNPAPGCNYFTGIQVRL